MPPSALTLTVTDAIGLAWAVTVAKMVRLPAGYTGFGLAEAAVTKGPMEGVAFTWVESGLSPKLLVEVAT